MNYQVIEDHLAFPEGPAFDSKGRLWWVELKAGNLGFRKDEIRERVPVGGEPNGIAIDARDRVVFCDAGMGAIRRYDPQSRETDTLADKLGSNPLFRPNDLIFDPQGNLIFTCPGDSRTQPTGYVAVLKPDGSVHSIASGFYFPNGLALTTDQEELIVAETRRGRLWKGTWYAEKCQWINPKPWADVGGKIGPDGMAFAKDGMLYVAIYGDATLKVVDPGGTVIQAIPIPGPNPTNCAFDPSGKLGLVVTEAGKGRVLSLKL